MSAVPDDPLADLPDPLPVTPLGGPVDAIVRPPGSKSITNRALVVAALAEGTSTLRNVLFADDTEAMLACLSALGVALDVDRAGATVAVHGTGGRLVDGPLALDARLSGTTARFLLPLLALGAGPYRLDGGGPLRDRPMVDGVLAVEALGAEVHPEAETAVAGGLPLTVAGGPVAGGRVAVAGTASSQFLSGLVLAGAGMAEGLEVTITGGLVSRPYVDMTLAVLAHFGAEAAWSGSDTVVVRRADLAATDLTIEPDASAASYFLAAPALVGGRVRVEGLGPGSWQGDVAFVDLLERMGAAVGRAEGALEVVVDGPLHGIRADLGDISDTAQTLAMVAVAAEGPTEVRGIGFIRRKETDRVAAVAHELARCGIDARETDDGWVIAPGTPRPATIATYHDHRMAMSFALLGLRWPGVRIADPRCVAKTYPGYWRDLAALGTAGADR